MEDDKPQDLRIRSKRLKSDTPFEVITYATQGDAAALEKSFRTFTGNIEDLNTALIAAARHGHPKCLALLLSFGADVNDPSPVFGGTPLLHACKYNYLECVNILLKAGADVNHGGDRLTGNTPLGYASKHGYLDCMRLLLSSPGIDVNKANNDGETPLLLAIDTTKVDATNILIHAKGIDVNLKDKRGSTAFFMAASLDYPDTVSLLLTVPGIDINARDNGNRSALSESVNNHNDMVVDVLIKVEGIDKNVTDEEGLTLMDMACDCGSATVSLKIMELGTDIVHSEHANRTVVMAMAALGEIDELERAIEAGISITRMDKHNKNALYFAAVNGHYCCLRELMQNFPEDQKEYEGMKKLFLRSSKMKYLFQTLPCLIRSGFFQWRWYPEYHPRAFRCLVQKFVVSGIPPGHFLYYGATSTPLHHAFLMNDLGLVKYILANFYLAAYDLHHFQRDTHLRDSVDQNGSGEVRELFDRVYLTPWRLETLALLAVSTSMRNEMTRHEVILDYNMEEHVPHMTLMTLNFKRPIRWLFIYDWDNIPVADDLSMDHHNWERSRLLMNHPIINLLLPRRRRTAYAIAAAINGANGYDIAGIDDDNYYYGDDGDDDDGNEEEEEDDGGIGQEDSDSEHDSEQCYDENDCMIDQDSYAMPDHNDLEIMIRELRA